MEKIINTISNELQVKPTQVENAIKLIDEGNTIPFIARYRKEVTGGLSDEQLRILGERLTYLRNLEQRKQEIIKSIEEQGKLTDEIVKQTEIATTLAEVEDIYRPYKQKKKTRATVAKAKGLEPLAEIIKEQKEKENLKQAKIVANLPYYITTPIIMKLLEEKLDIESITVMIQKEVADRLIEIPSGKNTGAITYTIYYYCDSEKIMEVPNSSFIPEPEVTSEVIKMKIRKEPVVKVENPKVMFMIIKSAFMQRRKTLLNALTNAQVFISKQEGIKILNKLGLNENVRAENLTIENYAELAKEISK